MTTLATDKVRDYELGDVNELPVIAADILYEGAAIGDNASGYMSLNPFLIKSLFLTVKRRKRCRSGYMVSILF